MPADEALGRRLAGLARSAPRASALAAVAVRGQDHAVARGHRRGERPVSAHTAFEVGSVSKTFTALLLAEMHQRGEVDLGDPAVRYLPPRHRPRDPAAQRLTLLHLATHTGGLRRVPGNLYPVALPRLFSEPYAAYTTGHLLRAAARVRPRPPPGRRVSYSNFGVGLLGYLLGRAAGQPYPRLIATRLAVPLGLTGTVAAPPAPDRAPPPTDLATGYWRPRRPVPPMTSCGLPAATGVHTTPADLLRYLRAHLRPEATPLAAALGEATRPRLADPRRGDRIALVWNVRTIAGRHEVYFHSGATRGFTAFLGFCPDAGVGLAALANTTASPWDRFIPAAYLLLRALILESG